MVGDIAADIGADPDAVSRVLTRLGERFDDVAIVAKRESERQSELAALTPLLVAVPMLDRDVSDLGDLIELSEGFAS